jgi:hypothetical protein
MPNCLEALFARGVEQGLERGLERGLLAGRIRALQQVLNQPTMTPRELSSKSLNELQAQAAELASLLNLAQQ